MNQIELWERYERAIARRQYRAAADALVALSVDSETPTVVLRECVMPRLDLLWAKLNPWWRRFAPRAQKRGTNAT